MCFIWEVHGPFACISVFEVLADIMLEDINHVENVTEEEIDDEILLSVNYDSDVNYESNEDENEETIDILQ